MNHSFSRSYITHGVYCLACCSFFSASVKPRLSVPLLLVSLTKLPPATAWVSNYSQREHRQLSVTDHIPFVVSPNPCVRPVTVSPTPFPVAVTTLPAASVTVPTPLPSVFVAAPSVLPEVSQRITRFIQPQDDRLQRLHEQFEQVGVECKGTRKSDVPRPLVAVPKKPVVLLVFFH